MAQHKAVPHLALGVQVLIAFLAYWFNQILAHFEGQICSYAGGKNHERHTHLQTENYEITKEKIQGKKEIGCPVKSFPEGNRVIFTLILFS